MFSELYRFLCDTVLEDNKGLVRKKLFFFFLAISNSPSHSHPLVFWAITSHFLSIPQHSSVLSYQFAPVFALGCMIHAMPQRDCLGLVIISKCTKLWHPFKEVEMFPYVLAVQSQAKNTVLLLLRSSKGQVSKHIQDPRIDHEKDVGTQDKHWAGLTCRPPKLDSKPTLLTWNPTPEALLSLIYFVEHSPHSTVLCSHVAKPDYLNSLWACFLVQVQLEARYQADDKLVGSLT